MREDSTLRTMANELWNIIAYYCSIAAYYYSQEKICMFTGGYKANLAKQPPWPQTQRDDAFHAHLPCFYADFLNATSAINLNNLLQEP